MSVYVSCLRYSVCSSVSVCLPVYVSRLAPPSACLHLSHFISILFSVPASVSGYISVSVCPICVFVCPCVCLSLLLSLYTCVCLCKCQSLSHSLSSLFSIHHSVSYSAQKEQIAFKNRKIHARLGDIPSVNFVEITLFVRSTRFPPDFLLGLHLCLSGWGLGGWVLDCVGNSVPSLVFRCKEIADKRSKMPLTVANLLTSTELSKKQFLSETAPHRLALTRI